MFEILAMIIFVVVQARLTSNDYKWLEMTTNEYKKWIRRQYILHVDISYKKDTYTLVSLK